MLLYIKVDLQHLLNFKWSEDAADKHIRFLNGVLSKSKPVAA